VPQIDPGSSNNPHRDENDPFKAPQTPSLPSCHLDISDLKPGSLQYAGRLGAALLSAYEDDSRPIPYSSFTVLCRLGLTVPSECAGSLVVPSLTPDGDRFAAGLSELDEDGRVFFMAAAYFAIVKSDSSTEVIDSLLDYRAGIAGLGSPDREFRKGLFALKRMKVDSDPAAVVKLLSSRVILCRTDHHLQTATLSPEWSKRDASLRWLQATNGGSYNDPPVAPQYKDRRERIHSESMLILRRSIMYSGSFWRLSGETMSLPCAEGRKPALLAQFAKDTFEHYSGLNSSDPNSSPGRGFLMSGARMDRLFFTGKGSGNFTKEQDSKYRRAFAALGDAFDEFPDAAFGFLRGKFIVYHPGDRYRLSVSGLSAPPPYVLDVQNDHLEGGYEYARLVPLQRFSKAIFGARFDFDNGPDRTTGDLALAGISSADLEQCGLEAPYVIDLANISTRFGGLIQGVPLGTDRLFSWELDQEPSVLWKDIRGRYHYGWLQRQHNNRMHQNSDGLARALVRDQLLKPYEDGSHEIFAVATGLFNLLEGFFHRYAAWKNDLVPGKVDVPRMAREVYRVHEAQRFGLPESEVPQLCAVNRSDFSISAEPIVDPKTLKLRFEGTLYQLPRSLDCWDSKEFDLWRRAVKSRVLHEGSETPIELAMVKVSYIEDSKKI
jgi:hypothetical protein